MFELMPHQRAGLEAIESHDGNLLVLAEQGTGKTLMALSYLSELLDENPDSRFLVVAPLSALGSWQSDIEMFDEPKRSMLGQAIELVNYDKVWRTNKDGQNPYLRHWDCVVADECHNIKNRTSKRSKALLELSKMSDHRIGMTGTPMANGHLEDMWSQLCFLENVGSAKSPLAAKLQVLGITGSYNSLISKYAELDKYFNPCRWRNVDEIQKVIADNSFRVTKADVLKDLPEKLPDHVIRVELAEKNIYNRIKKQGALVDYDIVYDNPLSQMLAMREVASGFLMDRDGKLVELRNNKIRMFAELLDSFPKEEPLVVFAEFTHSIDEVAKVVGECGRDYRILDGRQRNKGVWREFANGDFNTLIVQSRSGNAGINLQRCGDRPCTNMVFVELPVSSQVMSQARDRIHRKGQSKGCAYHILVTNKTIESDIYESLLAYQDFDKAAFERTLHQISNSRLLKYS